MIFSIWAVYPPVLRCCWFSDWWYAQLTPNSSWKLLFGKDPS